MEDETQLDDVADERSSFDVQLPIQIHSRPMSRISFSTPADVITVENNSLEKTEADGDQELIKQAHELGLEVPEVPEGLLEHLEPDHLVAHNASAITITSSQPAPSVTQSRTSNSTRPTSFSSSERQSVQKLPASTPSTAASLKSPAQSILSPSSRERSDSRFRKSIRRLSILGRRKVVDTTDLLRPSLSRNDSTVSAPPRPATADGTRSSSVPPILPPINPNPGRSVGSLLPSLSESRITTLSRLAASNPRPLTPPSEENEADFEVPDSPSIRAAKQRSLHCGRLQRLRIKHLDEQSSFLSARYAAFSSAREKLQPVRQRVFDSFTEQRSAALSRHATANSDLETRHLTAEMDLERALACERKACETRIKYMEAYCYGSRNRKFGNTPSSPPMDAAAGPVAAIPGMPARKVTEHDYRKLQEQYNLRNGMDQLHAARINVLREQQAKQAERIARRQEKELEGLEAERERELAHVKNEAEKEMLPLRKEWDNKKRKMTWRWTIKEAIERKTLEAERGEAYGELPEVVWPAEEQQVAKKVLAEDTYAVINEEAEQASRMESQRVEAESEVTKTVSEAGS